MATFVNLTPHALNVHRADGEVLTIPPSGVVARVSSTSKVVEVIEGVEVSEGVFGEVLDLPEREEGVMLVVSGMVLSALNGSRDDILAPGELVRDKDGRPIGCRGLRR